MHMSLVNACGSRVQNRMERKRIQFGLNTESFVDLNTGKFKSVKQWRKKCNLLVKLVVLG